MPVEPERCFHSSHVNVNTKLLISAETGLFMRGSRSIEMTLIEVREALVLVVVLALESGRTQ